MRQPANFVIPVQSVEVEGIIGEVYVPPMKAKVTGLGIYLKREVIVGTRSYIGLDEPITMRETQRSAITWQDLEEIIFAHFKKED